MGGNDPIWSANIFQMGGEQLPTGVTIHTGDRVTVPILHHGEVERLSSLFHMEPWRLEVNLRGNG